MPVPAPPRATSAPPAPARGPPPGLRSRERGACLRSSRDGAPEARSRSARVRSDPASTGPLGGLAGSRGREHDVGVRQLLGALCVVARPPSLVGVTLDLALQL